MSRKNWDVLDEDFGGGKAEKVSYVGTVDDDDDDAPATIVREPVRAPQRTRVVAPTAALSPAYRGNGGARMPQRQYGPASEAGRHHVTFGLISGNALTLNDEAVECIKDSRPMEMNGKMVRRAMPGTYIVFAEDQLNGGMGTNGWEQALGPQTWFPETSQPAAQKQQQQRDTSWLGQLFVGVGTAARGIAEAVSESRQQEREVGLQREQMRLDAQAQREATILAREEAGRQHQLALEEIRSQRQELEALQQETAALEEARARQAAARGALDPVSAGTSPVVWLMLGLLGLGVVGGGIYFLTRKK